jgi:hypothetical protein
MSESLADYCRTCSLANLSIVLLLTSGWALGGWSLVRHVFSIRPRGRLVIGLGLGLVLYITLTNLFANLLPLTLALAVASLSILIAGVWVSWKGHSRPADTLRSLWDDFRRDGLLLLVLAGSFFLFTWAQRGLALFDDYQHLPLISIMAAGDVPPHFYLNPAFKFAYHYGLQLLSASWVRVGGVFPWAAWKLGKGLAVAFSAVFAWLWVRRWVRDFLPASLGSFLLIFGGGARWLLLLVPSYGLLWLSSGVHMSNTGLDTASSLVDAIHLPWVIEGGGSCPFPFAFHNGVFVPVFFNLGSGGPLPFMTVLLLLLLVPTRRLSRWGAVVFGLCFASLALSAEHWFAFLWIGIFLVLIGYHWTHRKRLLLESKARLFQWWGILAGSAFLAAIQGGFITEALRTTISSAFGWAASSYNTHPFSLRWPPALLDAHLGELSLLDPHSLATAVIELGPVLLLGPLVVWFIIRHAPRVNWLLLGLALSSMIGLLFPIFIRYGVDRSITRMAATALWTWLAIGVPIAWYALGHAKAFWKVLAGFSYFALLFGGVVIFGVMLVSAGKEQMTYFIQPVDLQASREYWNRLPPDAQVFDVNPSRSVTLFGRIQRANVGIYEP